MPLPSVPSLNYPFDLSDVMMEVRGLRQYLQQMHGYQEAMNLKLDEIAAVHRRLVPHLPLLESWARRAATFARFVHRA